VYGDIKFHDPCGLALSSTCVDHPDDFSFIGTREVGAFTLNIGSDLDIGPPGNPNKPFTVYIPMFLFA